MQNVITPVRTEERAQLGIRPGDTVRVHQKIVERGKSRIQTFEGLVLATKHGTEAGATFTVRAMMSGIGVEKIFPLYAPFIDKIEITRRSKVRRAKLYFIREKVAREVRRQLRNMRMVKLSTDDFAEAPVEEVAAEEAPVTVEETMHQDPMQEPDATEATPTAEVAGAEETPEMQEVTVENETPSEEPVLITEEAEKKAS